MSRSTLDIAFSESLQSFLTGWGPIQWRQLLTQRAPEPDPSIAALLAALAAIEDDAFYMQVKIRYTGAGKYAALREFNAIWLAEESEHARALAALSGRFGGDGAARARPHGVWWRDRQSLLLKPFLWARGVHPLGMLAGYLTLGTLQEYVALTTYNAIAAQVDDPPTRDILHQIARQEARHMRFYRRGAQAVLADQPGAQRFVRFALSRYWRPPGIELLGLQSWFAIFAPLLRDPALRSRYLRADDICAGLPGLAGLDLMRDFLAQSPHFDPVNSPLAMAPAAA